MKYDRRVHWTCAWERPSRPPLQQLALYSLCFVVGWALGNINVYNSFEEGTAGRLVLPLLYPFTHTRTLLEIIARTHLYIYITIMELSCKKYWMFFNNAGTGAYARWNSQVSLLLGEKLKSFFALLTLNSCIWKKWSIILFSILLCFFFKTFGKQTLYLLHIIRVQLRESGIQIEKTYTLFII